VKIPLQEIFDPLISSSGINLFILRLDQVHPYISGNKFFKLKYNLEEAKGQGEETLLTFGGAYSNHIAATAAAGREFGFKTIGIIRGEELNEAANKTLAFARECGMQLHFISREDYGEKESQEFIDSLKKKFGSFYLLPEGGTNELAVKGCAEILSFINIPFDFVCCPVGTGGTAAGITSSLKEKQKVIGFPVLKGAGFLEEDISKLVNHSNPVLKGEHILNHNYHFGGYAKHSPKLLQFMDDFEKQNNIPLEHVYTGKMMFGIYDLISRRHFSKGSMLVAVHTGGLQGKLPIDGD
jgi:1-aminocyclopropane-1-carboxylate deaminase